jgi:predicted Fe-S protein YdhL (DUF1289 family)
MSGETTTPCIGVCSTIYGDDICRGCHRSFNEIIEWNSLSSAKKIKILERLENLQIKHSSKYLFVYDKDLLIKKFNELNIRPINIKKTQDIKNTKNNNDVISLAYQLIRHNISNITLENLNSFGISLNKKSESSLISPKDNINNINNLITKIDEAIYKDSEQNLAQANTITTGD